MSKCPCAGGNFSLMFVDPTLHQLPHSLGTIGTTPKVISVAKMEYAIVHRSTHLRDVYFTRTMCLVIHTPKQLRVRLLYFQVKAKVKPDPSTDDESRTLLWQGKTIITLGKPVILVDRGCILHPCSLIAQFRILALDSNLVSVYLNTSVSSTVKGRSMY